MLAVTSHEADPSAVRAPALVMLAHPESLGWISFEYL